MPEISPLQALPNWRYGSNAGQPLTRRDGILKVTGRATYAADNHPAGMLYAVHAVSTIARGRVVHLDVEAAKRHPGVVEVITPANRPPLAADPDGKEGLFAFRFEALQDDRVRYANQPIALVLAETLEAATEGAALLAPRYAAEPVRIGLDVERFVPATVGIGAPSGTVHGDLEEGLSTAARRIDAIYETPAQYHNAMEPHAIVASWDGDRLTLDSPNQAPVLSCAGFARFFGIPAENVLIRTPFIGGGFGSKAILAGPHVLCVLAARMTGRPVKLVFTRRQMFGPVGHRGETRQRLRLGMQADGRLSAIDHHAVAATSSFDDFIEPAAAIARSLYASPAISVSHEAVRNDIGTPGPVRAPGLASGSAALEAAIDEAAEACGLDPLDFRLRNYAEVEPITGKLYSSKALRECYAEGAKQFGWSGRPLAPRQRRDAGGSLVGWGMGTAMFHCPMFAAEARAVLRRDGTALVETSAIDMGQGALTALVQIAADSLGLDIDQVEFRAGSSDLPDGGVAGGSGHTATAGAAIDAAGSDAVGRLAELATADRNSPLFGAGNVGVIPRGGRLHRKDDESRSESYADILGRAGIEAVDGHGRGARDPATTGDRALQAHGAVFAEVKVDADLGQVRVTRLVGAFAAGRIINPRLALSQLYGGMVWGVSFALHEATSVDRRSGRVMNADLAEYHLPVNADVPSLEALLIHEDDPYVNSLGIKGVGEIGITGTVGAVANAVWHATGVRVRRFPMRIEDLLAPATGALRELQDGPPTPISQERRAV
jgi:xanthine dehydrogenase YagR molybdenum-binding subunit